MKKPFKQWLVIYAVLTGMSVPILFNTVDLDLAKYFYSRSGDSLWHFFDFLTEFGEGIYWILPPWTIYLFYRFFPELPLGLLAPLYRNARDRMYMAAFVGLTAFWSGLIVNILKLIFARYRPVEFFEHGNYGLTWFDHGYRLASFPSGHSTTAIGVAMALSLLFPRYWLPSMIIGIMVLLSRVVLTEHYLSDTVMGGFIGVVTALYIYERYYLKKMAVS
jgi:membrane-associated phospholipid phosphatase